MAPKNCTAALPGKRCVLAALLCAAIPIALAADTADDFGRYFKQGNSYFESEQYGLAIAEYDKAIECVIKAPPGYTLDYEATMYNYLQAYRNRILAYLNLENYDRVIQDSEFLIQIKDSSHRYDGYYYKGRALYQRKEYEPAISELSSAIALVPSNTKAYHTRMLAFYMTSRDDEARADCAAILRLDPTDEGALMLAELLRE